MKETAMPPYPWQAEVWAAFCESLAADRLPHALLVHGMEGVGVEDLADAMARYLLCHAPLEDVACGRCKGCTLLKAGSHPDIFILKREDATQIKVDQVRACVEFVSKTAHFDHMKVVVVQEADRMNINAANALLKSLEEPQGNVVFILMTHRVSKLLATIRSRCQSVQVKEPANMDAMDWLDAQSIPQAERLLALSGGAPLKAKAWSDSDFIGEFEQLSSDLLALLNGREGVLQVSSRWQKKDFVSLLEMQILLLDMAIKAAFNNGGKDESAVFSLVECLTRIDSSLLFRIRDGILTKLEQAQSFANLNEALLVEELAMDWFVFHQILLRNTGSMAL